MNVTSQVPCNNLGHVVSWCHKTIGLTAVASNLSNSIDVLYICLQEIVDQDSPAGMALDPRIACDFVSWKNADCKDHHIMLDNRPILQLGFGYMQVFPVRRVRHECDRRIAQAVFDPKLLNLAENHGCALAVQL